jgi:hypothetical protein
VLVIPNWTDYQSEFARQNRYKTKMRRTTIAPDAGAGPEQKQKPAAPAVNPVALELAELLVGFCQAAKTPAEKVLEDSAWASKVRTWATDFGTQLKDTRSRKAYDPALIRRAIEAAHDPNNQAAFPWALNVRSALAVMRHFDRLLEASKPRARKKGVEA